MEPINYNIDVASPFQSALQGMQSGLAIHDASIAEQQKQLALQQQKQMQTDIGGLVANPNPTAKDFAGIMVKYPQLSEQFKRSWDVLNADQQQTKLSQATQVYAALQAKQPEIASQLLSDNAIALRNSGKEDEAKAAETLSQFVKLHPEGAKTTAALQLAAIMGPDKFADTFGKLGQEQRAEDQAPADLKKKQADADLAAIKAKYGDQSEVADLATKGWNIKKIEEDIKINKENSRIALMNAATAREGNAIKKQELQLNLTNAIQARDQKIRDQINEVTTSRNTIDNFLNTADQILKAPDSVKRAALGPVDSRLPTMQPDVADYEAKIESLNAEAFQSQVSSMKGLGALSDAEGKKLTAALQSFDQKQSPEQFDANVKEAQRLMLKARSAVAAKYGIPENTPDTPAAKPDATTVDALLKKYGAAK